MNESLGSKSPFNRDAGQTSTSLEDALELKALSLTVKQMLSRNPCRIQGVMGNNAGSRHGLDLFFVDVAQHILAGHEPDHPRARCAICLLPAHDVLRPSSSCSLVAFGMRTSHALTSSDVMT